MSVFMPSVPVLEPVLKPVPVLVDEAAGLKREVNPLLLEVSQSNVNRVSGSWNNFNRFISVLNSIWGKIW